MYVLGVEGGSERFSNMGHCSGPSRTGSNTGERWIESPFGAAGEGSESSSGREVGLRRLWSGEASLFQSDNPMSDGICRRFSVSRPWWVDS